MNRPDREPSHPGYVDVTVMEFAAHTAYLDPLTGTGYLVLPRPSTDVPAPQDPLVEAAWDNCLEGAEGEAGLSLYEADLRSAFEHLAQDGWEPLLDDAGEIEEAGWTTDGRRALCLYAVPFGGEPDLESLQCALLALDIASDVHVRVHDADEKRADAD
ncbi:hypothetical protein [Kribbella sp. NPDC048915]|uniref:hypothetical protein n=1 Tax=Kribbella sp. NPDC048915 TaxID=3155148 RepID=UPI0033FC9944